MVIVDSTVWIDYFRGVTNAETDWLNQQLPHRRIGLADLALCEVLQGIRAEADFNRVRESLLRFQVFALGGETLAITSARNYRILRTYAITVRKTIDCLIATFCMLTGH